MARSLRGSVAVLLACVAMACGVPQDEAPRELSKDGVPFGLLSPATTQTTAVVSQPAVSAIVYLIRQDRLVAVPRQVRSPVSSGRLLNALLEGPTEDEAMAGFRSAISSEARVRDVTASAGVVTIELSEEFVEVAGQDQILALAQIVFTATETDTAGAVRFRLAGEPVEVPRGDGTLTSAALTRADYAALAPA